MKIVDIKSFVIKAGLPVNYPHPTASYVVDGAIFLEIHTDEGVIGLGEPGPYGGKLEDIQKEVADLLKNILIGKDPFQVSLLTVQLENFGIPAYGNTPRQAALAGISQALWDIVGKSVGIPVYRLINQTGDIKTKIRAYASGGMYYEHESTKLFVEEAILAKEQGYTAWKLRPQTPETASHFERNKRPPKVNILGMVKILEDVRLAVGSSMDLMIDLGCRLETVDDALDFAIRVEDLGLLFIEEPIPRLLVDYVQLIQRSPVPIAGGECFVSRHQFLEWMPALDVFQPDCNLAGMTEAKHVLQSAQQEGKVCILHNWTNDINCAANLHLAASAPSCVMVESNTTCNPLRNHLVIEPFVPIDGFFHMNDKPGLGIEIDRDRITTQ